MMKEPFYKNLSFSFLVIITWSNIAFFIHYFEEPDIFESIDVLLYYILSCWIASGTGLLLLFFHIFTRQRFVRVKFFFFVLSASLNIYYSLLYITLLILELLTVRVSNSFLANLATALYTVLLLRKMMKGGSIPVNDTPISKDA